MGLCGAAHANASMSACDVAAVGMWKLLKIVQGEFNLSGPFWDWIAMVNSGVWWGNKGILCK
ncbi:MAG: hypothetical protein OWQ51_10410 [Pyrobaculum arsenaticum]|uniref:hypothetical protein n=1 Tax=Pyrobaculum arsenaticum TaxID=121277 RepID=UPI000B17410D|nr:hypothetical protein [Pyrobaculum arsenaticum]MCY0891365.1 hypothetical protein [Pyrobaculum arsenaticum]